MVKINRQQLGVVILRAAVKTETRVEWISRQVKQSEVCKPSEEAGCTVDVVVDPGNKFVVVPARTGGRGKVIHDAPCRWGDIIFIPHRGPRLAKLRLRYLIVRVRCASAGSSHSIRVIELDSLRQKRGEITLPESREGNGCGQDRTRPQAELFPAPKEEKLVLDDRAAARHPVLILHVRRRLVTLA